MQMKRTKGTLAMTKFDHYLDDDVLQRNDDFDILIWWKVLDVKYPIKKFIA